MPKGGKRPGAGAPSGNLNAFKTGRTSRQYQRLLEIVSHDPEALRLIEQLLDDSDRQALRRRRYAMQVFAKVLERHEQEVMDRTYEAMMRDRDRFFPRLYPDRLD